jgi:hypothetical protein
VATPTRLRNQIRGLTRLADGDLAVVWRRNLSESALRDALPSLVAVYGAAAASMAADWYDEFRDAHTARGRFRAIPAEIADSGEQALVGWAFSEAVDEDSLKVLVAGGMQRRIANFARFTVTASSVEDPAAEGWVRVGEGACKSGWCDQYLDGEVRSVPYDFPAHDNCHCAAVPAF